jgi:hypothetical protein
MSAHLNAHHRTAAIIACAGAALYVALMAAVHVIQPHMLDDATISKYALGRDGWMLQAAFVSAGVAYAGLSRLLTGRSALLGWVTAVAFVVMGTFRIDAAGPEEVVSLHGALHTGAFFVVVVTAHVLMFTVRRWTRLLSLRVLAFVSPVLAIVGFGLPGLAGGLVFRSWTLCLVAWVVLTAREAAARNAQQGAPAFPVTV